MDDTTNSADLPEVDTSLPEDTGQTIDQTELDEYGNPLEAEPEDDSEEIEHDGQKFRIPKALKSGFMMNRDYTQKTQDLAAERQAFEAQRTEYQRISNAEIDALTQVRAIDAELQQFKQVDWRQWFENDPQRAQAFKIEYDLLKERHQELEGKFNQARDARQLHEARETKERLQKGHAELTRDIPGWNVEKARALSDFGQKTFGFSAEEIGAISDPRMIKVLHAAYEHSKATAQQRTAQQIQSQQAIKPAAKVSGASTAPKAVSDRQSTDDWMASRNKQVAANRR